MRSPIIPSRGQYVDKMETVPANGQKSPLKTRNGRMVSRIRLFLVDVETIPIDDREY